MGCLDCLVPSLQQQDHNGIWVLDVLKGGMGKGNKRQEMNTFMTRLNLI